MYGRNIGSTRDGARGGGAVPSDDRDGAGANVAPCCAASLAAKHFRHLPGRIVKQSRGSPGFHCCATSGCKSGYSIVMYCQTFVPKLSLFEAPAGPISKWKMHVFNPPQVKSLYALPVHSKVGCDSAANIAKGKDREQGHDVTGVLPDGGRPESALAPGGLHGVSRSCVRRD